MQIPSSALSVHNSPAQLAKSSVTGGVGGQAILGRRKEPRPRGGRVILILTRESYSGKLFLNFLNNYLSERGEEHVRK